MRFGFTIFSRKRKMKNKSEFLRKWWQDKPASTTWQDAEPDIKRAFGRQFNRFSDYQTFLRAGHVTGKLVKRRRKKTASKKVPSFYDFAMDFVKSNHGDFAKTRSMLQNLKKLKTQRNIDLIIAEIDKLKKFHDTMVQFSG